MTNKTLFLNSDILIGLLHGTFQLDELKSKFDNYQSIATTIINIFEIYYGFHQLKYSKQALSQQRLSEENNSLELLIQNINISDLSVENAFFASDIYHKLKSEGKMIDIFDCIIAGIIISSGSPDFLTMNKKHFQRISGLNLISL